MDCMKIGSLIYRLRTEKHYTQLELAQKMNISDKAVSKWERGLGCPDVSLLPLLAECLGIELENLLTGELDSRELIGGNMKKTVFYVCPQCGNLVMAAAECSISCCGKKLSAMTPRKAEEEEKLRVEIIESDYYITTTHEMKKEHYISFVALLTGDGIMLRKLYPEWDMQARIPCFGHGMLVWHCTRHGLMYQPL